jgi:hypothetical protein
MAEMQNVFFSVSQQQYLCNLQDEGNWQTTNGLYPTCHLNCGRILQHYSIPWMTKQCLVVVSRWLGSYGVFFKHVKLESSSWKPV